MSSWASKQARPSRPSSTLIAGRPGFGAYASALAPPAVDLTGIFIVGRSIIGGSDVLAPRRQEAGGVATETDRYGLPVYSVEAFDSPGAQKITKTIDAALGGLLIGAPVTGVISGWSIGTDKTISAGAGIVGGCYCITVAATDISSLLSNNATNYVYAIADATSPDQSTVTFAKVASPAMVPPSAVQLGTITLNSGGTVTATSDNHEDFLRDYLPPVRKRLIPQQTVLDPDTSAEYITVPVGESVVVDVDHSTIVTFSLPGKVYVTTDPHVNVTELADGLTGSAFRLLVTNNWTSEYGDDYVDYAYGYGDETQVQVLWQRDGLV